MDDNTTQYLIIVNGSETEVPIATISRKNFIKFTMLDDNNMRIYVNRLDQFTNIWREVHYDFEILPNNKHMLQVRNW